MGPIGKADELLTRIAKETGVTCLSDLHEIKSVKFLFSIFLRFNMEDYSIEDWKEVLSYLFGLSGPERLPLLEKEVVLWNMGRDGTPIVDAIKEYFASRGLSSSFHHVTEEQEPHLDENKKYLVFYRSSDPKSEKSAREFTKRKKLDSSFAAICSSYDEGIASMERGDCYALQLPLRQDKVVRCFEHFQHA